MRAKPALAILALGMLVGACAPEPQPPVNSPAFARRAPAPGQTGYLETIKYIDNGIRYVAENGGFFVSAAGEMCFYGPVNMGLNRYANPQDYWCIDPAAVASVDAIENDISYINQVRLWCRHAAPQCAHKTGYPNILDDSWIANSITTQTVPFREQRAAIGHLIYLMGGNTRGQEPPR